MILNELFDDFGDSPGKQEEIPPIGLFKVVDYIKTHCSDIVSAFKAEQTLLYRGFSHDMNVVNTSGLFTKPFFIGQSQINRKPVGLDSWQHDILVRAFNMVGFKASRDKTISCTSSFSAAKTFGHPFFIFPLNGFDYTWSTKFDDIGRIQADPRIMKELKAQDFLTKVYDKNHNEEDVSRYIPFSLNTARKIIKYFGFTDRNLSKALDNRHEIAIRGRYVAINTNVLGSIEMNEWLSNNDNTKIMPSGHRYL